MDYVTDAPTSPVVEHILPADTSTSQTVPLL
jgi:hypothetical protein